MNKLQLIQFLITQKENMEGIYGILGIAIFLYSIIKGQWLILAAGEVFLFIIYLWTPIWTRKAINRIALDRSSGFNRTFKIEYPTSEKIIDSIDIEILGTIRDIGGNPCNFLLEILELYPIDDTISRLSKLYSFGYIKLYRNGRVSITNLGLDTLNVPPVVFRSTIDPAISTKIAEVRMDLQNEKYYDVIVKTSKFFEGLTKKKN